jgi:repressor LexA
MSDELSDKQIEIMEFIEVYIRRHRMPPTNREIGEQFYIKSTGHVDYHLSVLEEKGYISRVPKKSRSIRVLRPLLPSGVPIQGTIAAGLPLDMFDEGQVDTLDLSVHAPESEEYALLVRGHSMIDEHIADGDYVIIVPTKDIHDGDIVVALHRTAGGERGAVTLKRIFREVDGFRLQPANSEVDPIFVPGSEWDEEWEVQGKVTAVYRRCAL